MRTKRSPTLSVRSESALHCEEIPEHVRVCSENHDLDAMDRGFEGGVGVWRKLALTQAVGVIQ